jgi:tetratricopeptide (TPR) repeat protein
MRVRMEETAFGFFLLVLAFSSVGVLPTQVLRHETTTVNMKKWLLMQKVEGLVINDDVKDLPGKGNDLFERKDYDGAMAVYQDIITNYPDAYPLLRNIGNCYFAREKCDPAEENYLELLEKDPKKAGENEPK